MKLTPAQIATYHRDGVLPLGQLLDSTLVTAAVTRLEALRAQKLMDTPAGERNRKTYRLLNTSSKDAWFKKLYAHPAVLDVAESILGPNLQYFQDNIFYKPARDGAGTPWHQDNIWWHANPPHMLTIWIALDDVDAGNGAVQYIPGSHTHLIEPEMPVDDNGYKYKMLSPEQTAQIDTSKAVTFRVPAGHAVMHHCLTLHGAPPNNSDRTRRGYTVHLAQTGVIELDPATHPILRGAKTTQTGVFTGNTAGNTPRY